MNIEDDFKKIKTISNHFNDSKYCFINGNIYDLNVIKSMSYDKFCKFSINQRPKKLYKYFPNISCKVFNNENQVIEKNYSKEALLNNTVFLQSPNYFDDVFDSDFNVDFETFEKNSLNYFCKYFNIENYLNMNKIQQKKALVKYIESNYHDKDSFEKLLNNNFESQLQRTIIESFVKMFIIFRYKCNQDCLKSIESVFWNNYEVNFNHLRNIFRVTCFTTSPFSQLMWGASYSNFHKGFCVEYTIDSNSLFNEEILKLLPMIYCKRRGDVADKLSQFFYSDMTDEDLWFIYFNGALRKSFDWAYQNEWRLIQIKSKELEKTNYTVPFFPITKVYLGNRMNKEDRLEIIEICRRKHIPYSGIVRDQIKYEMIECSMECDKCPSLDKH